MLALFMLYTNLLILGAGNRYKRFIATMQFKDFEKALSNQRKFWLIMGIVSILSILIYGVGVFAIANDVVKLLGK